MSYKKCRIAFLLIFVLCMACLPVSNAYAASGMKLYYYATNKNVTYTDKQVKYILDGSSINMGSTPGILVNGYALASYQDVFAASPMKITAKYSSTKGTITLSKDDTTLVLTIGSKKAQLNGKSVTLDIAPAKIKYVAQGTVKILVPTRFVAETFGYTYVWNSSTSTVSMTSPRRLYYNNKKVAYNGASGNVTVDGAAVNLGTMKSIIVNSTALLQAKKVFSLSNIGADYTYDTGSKTITLTKDSTVVTLVIGSTSAYVNGNKKIMDTAPLVVKDLNTNQSYIMVPGSFVAGFLGYNYSWNSSTKTSVITTKTSSGSTSGSGSGSSSGGTSGGSTSGNSQGDTDDSHVGTGTVPSLETVLFDWNIQDSYASDYTAANNLSNTTLVQNPSVSDPSMSAYVNAVNKETAMDSVKEIYSIHSAAPFSSATVALSGSLLTVHMANTMSAALSTYFGGTVVQSVALAQDASGTSTDAVFTLNNSAVKYEVTLSDDKCTMYVTLYPNYLGEIKAGSKSGKDYVLINSLSTLNVNVTDGGNCLILQIPGTVNAIGSNTIDTSASPYLKSLQLSSDAANNITIVIGKTADSKFNVAQNGNTYMVSLYNQETVDAGAASVSIPLPAGVDLASVEDEDRYYDKKIALILPGDYQAFYASNPVSVQNSVVSNVSVVNNDNNQTEIIIATSKLQGYKLANNNGSIAMTLGNPRDIYQNIVVLDPGHGGSDPGAIYSLNGKSLNEKDINLSILYDKASQYFNSRTSKIKAYYTRMDDTFISLSDRAAFAGKVGADLFVSLHMNALPSKTDVNGTEVYYGLTNNNVADSGLDSETLADFMLDYLPGAVGVNARYVKGSNLYVNKNNSVPAILIELGYMTNKSDLTKMVDDSFQDTVGGAIYDALCGLFELYPTGR